MCDAYRKLGLILLIALWLGVLTPLLVAQRHLSHEDQCIAQVRVIALAMTMYLQDYDEVYPLAFGRDTTGSWLWNRAHPVPHDWVPPDPVRDAAHASMWANAILPYLSFRGGAPRYDLLHCPATIATKIAADTRYANPRRRPAKVSYTYNGLLHRLLYAQVLNPTDVPLLWEGQGRTYPVGYAISNPTLRCENRSVECQYQPRSQDGSCIVRGAMFIADSMWIHPKGTVMAYADGHANWRRLGLVIAPNDTDPNYDPYTGYNTSGVPTNFWWDDCNPLIFRPY
jgi:prepilin-type processing-associated H-X9-DG protein